MENGRHSSPVFWSTMSTPQGDPLAHISLGNSHQGGGFPFSVGGGLGCSRQAGGRVSSQGSSVAHADPGGCRQLHGPEPAGQRLGLWGGDRVCRPAPPCGGSLRGTPSVEVLVARNSTRVSSKPVDQGYAQCMSSPSFGHLHSGSVPNPNFQI